MATKFGTKSAITRLIYEISVKSLRMTGGFRVGLLNDARQILLRPNPVAMATKFETKWAITHIVWEISPRCLRLVGFFLAIMLLNDVRQFKTTK